MVAKTKSKSLILSILLLMGCVEPFDIPVRNEDVAFLVVDGYVDTKTHTATVILSRAIPLSDENAFSREANASVAVEDSDGSRYVLIETTTGSYQLTNPSFENNRQFRLHITTSGKKEYYSEFITPKVSPPIDAIGWTPEEEGFTIKIGSEDLTQSTRYYRWEYTETWRYESPLSSEFKIENGEAVTRTASEQVKTCYRSENSTKIIIATTTDFAQDKFVDQPILFIPKASTKTKFLYSALVRQFGLSKEAYEYWEQLRVNTESLGGLFDPQPAQLRGNISNRDDTTEPVIGYFDGGSVSEKRIFIEFNDLPRHLRVYSPPPLCVQESVAPNKVNEVGSSFLLTYGVYEGPALVAYMYTSVDCADCTRFGGSTIKPDFWPN
jgi:hypothetical protein